MTTLLVAGIAAFVWACFIAPWLDTRRRRRRVRRTSCARIAPRPRPVTGRDAPHWTRDPSPNRRLSDYEWRALADGEMQT